MQIIILALLSLFLVTQAFRSAVPPAAHKTLLRAEKSKSVPFMDAPKHLEGLPGYKGFDPIGFSEALDTKFLVEAEIKHCRVAMLGWLGFVATEFIHLPGDVYNVGPLEAHNAAVASGSMFQILAAVVAAEAIGVVALKNTMDGGDRAPGDFGIEYVKSCKTDADKFKMREKEIENGRAAMLAFSGVVTQAALGHHFPYLP
mmetsp:Transcript_96276/g.272137  ORF Transcript_96276/g.272137 Transcript_96276/m.272137 type:complete len:201 (+) Transcript_96276:39-641(+)